MSSVQKSSLETSDGLIRSLKEILDQGISLLDNLSNESYIAKTPLSSGASIGAHYRHCLDHFSALLSGDPAGGINYDARKRDPILETDRGAARRMTAHLSDLASSLDAKILQSPVVVRCGVSYADKESSVVNSSYEREVMFSISHAVHHYALIAMIGRSLEVAMPDGFGVAPSTVHYRKENEVARP
jgi:hypothetical protein